jgi:hypothetical protein
MADWYYARNGQHQGPVTSAQLKQMAAAGQIGPDDLVFKEGSTQWVAASTVAGLFPAGGVSTRPAPAPAPAPARGRRDEPEEVGELPSGEDIACRPSRRGSSDGGLVDILFFRAFVTPWVIIIIFWIGVLIDLYYGFIYMKFALDLMRFDSAFGATLLLGVIIMVPAGILAWRIICECFLVFFRAMESLSRTNESLGAIRQELQQRK